MITEFNLPALKLTGIIVGIFPHLLNSLNLSSILCTSSNTIELSSGKKIISYSQSTLGGLKIPTVLKYTIFMKDRSVFQGYIAGCCSNFLGLTVLKQGNKAFTQKHRRLWLPTGRLN